MRRPRSRSSVASRPALAGDPAAAHDEDAVREGEDLLELDRDDQDRDAGVAQRDEPAVDELDRADVDAARRLADDQHLRAALDLARQHDLLLVAAGEFAGLEPRRRRADVVARHLAREVRDHPAVIEERTIAEGGVVGEAERRALEGREGRNEPGAQPVLRHVQQARVAAAHADAAPRGASGARRAGSCRAPDGACRRAPPGARSGRCRRRPRRRRSRRPATAKRDLRDAQHAAAVDDRQVLDLEHGRRPARRGGFSTRSSTRRPTISSASSAGEVVAVSSVATISPRRITETRSVAAMTSRSLWVMRMTVLPCASQRRAAGRRARRPPPGSAPRSARRG